MDMKLGRVFKSIVESWESYLAILVSITTLGLITLDFFGVGFAIQILNNPNVDRVEILTAATLLALTLISINLIGERSSTTRLENALRSILYERAHLSADDFFEEAELDTYAVLKPKIRGAREIWLLGISNLKTLKNYQSELEQALRNGAKLKVLMLDPDEDNIALTMQAKRSLNPFGLKSAYSHGIESYGIVCEMKRACPNPSMLEVKGLDYLPSFGCLAIDPDKPAGQIRVKIYPFRQSKSKYPTFLLLSNRDKLWYPFYKNQFDLLWQAAKSMTDELLTDVL